MLYELRVNQKISYRLSCIFGLKIPRGGGFRQGEARDDKCIFKYYNLIISCLETSRSSLIDCIVAELILIQAYI